MRQWLIVAALTVLLGPASAAHGAVTATPDPEGGMRTDEAMLFTVDPFAPEVTAIANRGITADRRLRQSFKNPTGFNVGEIIVSLDVSDPAPGLSLRFFEVADVTAGDWTEGDLVKEIVVFGDNLAASTNYVSIALTGGDVFTLPARGTAEDNLGYGLEISHAIPDSSDTRVLGSWIWTNATDDMGGNLDFYPDGRAYRESGGAEPLRRDFGLSLFASMEAACDPGDVNCDMVVDEIDLSIIAAHFRQIGNREDGDLTGNGFIDFDDFGEWKQHFPGAFPGSGSDLFNTVPEPNGLALMMYSLFSLLPLVVRRR